MTFIKARVAAEMKKKISYNVDMSVDEHGVVVECQCDCGAGMGPEAHCKHVCVIIFAVIKFSHSKHIIVRKTCTETLQTFHRVKQYTGGPLESKNLNLKKSATAKSFLKDLATYDPRPSTFVKTDNYSSHFFNLCLNYSTNTMPITQLVKPANLYAVAHDHDYLELPPEEMFLRKINVSQITNSKIKEIESKTKDQHKNSEWVKERCLRITSSNFGKICTATSRTDFTKLSKALLKRQEARSPALDHGRMYESTALKQYAETTGNEYSKCGLMICKSHPFLASSPDGLVGEDIVLEVKCPYSARNVHINSVHVPYLREAEDGGFDLKTSHNYYHQVQGQMLCTGRNRCHFIVFTFKHLIVIEIERDDEFIAGMVDKLKSFYEEHFRGAVLKKHFYRNYEICQC